MQVVVRATDDEADAIADRLGEAICVPSDHDGECLTPWVPTRAPVDDLDEPDRTQWRDLLRG